MRLGSEAWTLLFHESGLEKALLIAFVCQICLYYADLYELRVASDRRELFIRIVQALSATSFLLGAIYFWFAELVIGRGVFMASSVLVILVRRRAGVSLFEWLTRQVAPRERLLLVGTGPAAVGLARELLRAAAGTRRRDRRLRRSRSGTRRSAGYQSRASSARSRTFRRSCGRAASIVSSSASPTRAASCRWTSCSR